jgi:predicted TIM-barrel fold metal-dependent hydrolase
MPYDTIGSGGGRMTDAGGMFSGVGGMDHPSGPSSFANPPRDIDPEPPYRRIAVEEAWSIPEIPDAQRRHLSELGDAADSSLRNAGMFASIDKLQAALCDLGPGRIARMDALGIHKQLLLLTAPGVQVLDAGRASDLAALSNDRLAQAVADHPDRYAGLLAFAPQDVSRSVSEIERGMTRLGLKGAVVNSHTGGRYLDEPDFLSVLEALEAHDAALYIHPTIPGPGWAEPYLARGVSGALAGYTHEVWLHVLGLILSGAFDRFPRLRVIIGHMGEAMPLLLYRLDWMQSNADGREDLMGRRPAVRLRHKMSHYFLNNIWITTSGVAWEPAIRFCQQVLGPERVLYAMDYPYQADRAEVAAYDALDIPAAHKRMLMQTNAETVFQL